MEVDEGKYADALTVACQLYRVDMKSGRTELFEGLLGLRPHHAESVEIGGRAVGCP